jgi:hypothetical protein
MVGTARVEAAVQQLKSVFLEIPGTQLTLVQAIRLTGLEPDTCLVVLGALEDARFLRQRSNGSFVQRSAESPDA